MSTLRTLLFGPTRSAPLVLDLGSLVLRLFTGLALAFAHGQGKLPPSEGFVDRVMQMGFPAPEFFAWCAGLGEFVGGLLLALGLLTRPAALFAGATTGVAAFIRHAPDPFGAAEKAMLYTFVLAFFVLAGAGRFSVDNLIRRRFE